MLLAIFIAMTSTRFKYYFGWKTAEGQPEHRLNRITLCVRACVRASAYGRVCSAHVCVCRTYRT
jgi:hypothetical protein